MRARWPRSPRRDFAPSRDAPAVVDFGRPTGHGGFAHCLSEHGAPTAPGPRRSAAGVDQDTWHRAMQACSSLAPGRQLSQHGRLACIGEPLLLQPVQRAVPAKGVDGPRYAAGERTALVEHDAELLDIA